MRRFVVVDADGAHAAVRQAARDDDGRDVRVRDGGEHLLAVAQRRRQDDAVQAVLDEAARLFRFMLAGFAFFHEQLDVVQARLAQEADEELAQVRRARVTVQEADADRLGAREVARLLVRRVVQRRHGVRDLAPRAFAHESLAVHDARDRHGGHARELGDVGHRRLAPSFQLFLDGLWFGLGHSPYSPSFFVCAILALSPRAMIAINMTVNTQKSISHFQSLR